VKLNLYLIGFGAPIPKTKPRRFNALSRLKGKKKVY